MKATGIVRRIEECVIIGLLAVFIHSKSEVNFTSLFHKITTSFFVFSRSISAKGSSDDGSRNLLF